MSKKLADLSQINEELSGALSLLQERLGDFPVDKSTQGNIAQGTDSLLDRCADVVGEDKKTKPVIRVIHHLACSGGTLISKCISALPGTYLLSEVHPNSSIHIGAGTPRFSPSDITDLARHANIPNVEAIAKNIFKNNVDLIDEHLNNLGGTLVLREHSHSDYCVGKNVQPRSTLISVLEEKYEVLSLVTVRNPVDCYLSMRHNGWLHFEPTTFDEYCRRYLSFLKQFSSERIIKYEDFIDEPDTHLAKMAQILELPYTDTFRETFSIFKVTGDSGRGSETIEKKARRGFSKELSQEIVESEAFQIILERLNYDDDIENSN